MTQAGWGGLAGRPHRRGAPRRIHLITDADCGYTLEEIRAVPGSQILYAELHQRPTDDRRQRSLPAIAVMRSADELPAVGREFTPEIVTDAVRGTTALSTGRVEAVWEEPPSRLVDEELGERVDDDPAGVPTEWVEDLAAARQALGESDAALATNDARRRDCRAGE